MAHLIIDIETNLAHDKLHCVGIYDPASRQRQLYTSALNMGTYPDARPYSELPAPNACVYVAHNGVRFDFPKLKEFLDWDVPTELQRDTYLMAKAFDPNLPGGHSLANLAKLSRSPLLKTDFDTADFDGPFTAKMADYCLDDNEVLAYVHDWLVEQLARLGFADYYWLQLEQDVRRLTDQQERNGFALDVVRAEELYADLSSTTAAIASELQNSFPPIVHERYSEKTGKRLKDRVEEFNPGSRLQIARRLEGLGVKWTKFTEKTENGRGGNVVVDEATLKPWAAKIPEAKLVLDYLTTQKKQSQVASWLKAVGDDGRIHGRVDTYGAVTGRMTHSQPNLAQVDKDPRMRSCFVAEGDNVLVGVDASGLELRMLAHYMNEATYIHAVLEGDVHWTNTQALELVPLGTVRDEDNPEHEAARNKAKTFIYAFLYGAGDAKIGSIVGGSARRGKQLKELFLSNTPALKALREKVARMAQQGHLPGLDGRRLRVRHQHAALNTLLQGAAAVVMKKALVLGCQALDSYPIPYKLVAQVHDEIQTETSPTFQTHVGEAFVNGIVLAGEALELRLPLAGEAKYGNSWAETH